MCVIIPIVFILLEAVFLKKLLPMGNAKASINLLTCSAGMHSVVADHAHYWCFDTNATIVDDDSMIIVIRLRPLH